MPDPQATLALLSRLSAAYPSYTVKRETMQLYIQILAEVPLWLLRKAVIDHISNSAYFPKISELRARAEKIYGGDITHLREWSDPLAEQECQLQYHYAHTGELDEEIWQELIDNYIKAGREHRAIGLRTRMDQIRRMQRGEFDFARYNEWLTHTPRQEEQDEIGANPG